MVGLGSSDPMDYHALEAMQCMIERRRGGETGVKAVQMIEGEEVWRAGEEGRWSKELLESARSRSDSPRGLTDEDERTRIYWETASCPDWSKAGRLLRLSGGQDRGDHTDRRGPLSGRAYPDRQRRPRSCLTSQQQGGKRLETPHLDVAYQAPRESHHARR